MASGVYLIKCLVKEDARCYIGSSVDVEKRWNEHKGNLNKCIHHNFHLQLAWDEYGEENFEFSVVELVEDKNQLLEAEQRWLDNGDNLFNIARNACAPMSGLKFSEEHRRRIGKAQRGKLVSEETKKKISESLKGEKHPMHGKHLSEKRKCEIGKVHKGKVLDEETKKKISESLVGRELSEAHRKKMSESLKGKKNPMCGKTHCESVRQKISETHKGKTLSEEHKCKIGKARKGKKHSAEIKRIMRNQQRKRRYVESMMKQGFKKDEIYAV